MGRNRNPHAAPTGFRGAARSVAKLAPIACALLLTASVALGDRRTPSSIQKTVVGDGCQGKRAQSWAGYTRLSGRTIRLVWVDSGSREPCKLRLRRNRLALFTDDPSIVTGDAYFWCREIRLSRRVDPDRLTDASNGKRHRAGKVALPGPHRSIEATLQQQLETGRDCRKARRS